MSQLSDALSKVDWPQNIATSLAYGGAGDQIDHAAQRLAVWSKQFETLDAGNPALSFVREMQIAMQSCGVLIGLCLYKQSAAAARTMVETCLYYSFFRTHPAELRTLASDPKFFVSKADIIDFHKTHTPRFGECQAAFGLVGRLQTWYSEMSAVVHGQVPGVWNAHSAIHEISFSEPTHHRALAAVIDAEQLLHEILLCTAGKELWSGVAPDAKLVLLKGLPGAIKTTLALDAK